MLSDPRSVVFPPNIGSYRKNLVRPTPPTRIIVFEFGRLAAQFSHARCVFFFSDLNAATFPLQWLNGLSVQMKEQSANQN